MGLFDEQIKLRKLNDEKEFEESFLNIAGVLVGDRHNESYRDEKRISRDAIGAVLKFYHLDMPDIPDAGADAEKQLDLALRPYGIMKRRVKLVRGWHKNAYGAMLLKKDDGDFLALIPDKLGGYSYYDSETGQLLPVTDKDAPGFFGEAFCFYTTFPLGSIGLRELLVYCLESFSISDIISLIGAGAAISGVGLLIPYINKLLFEKIVSMTELRHLIAVAVFLICASVSVLLFTTIEQIVLDRITLKMGIRVEAAATIRLLGLPAGFFKKYSSGELSARLGYLNQLCSTMINILLKTSLTALWSVVYVFQIVSFTPSLLMPAIGITITAGVISLISTLMEIGVAKNIMETGAKVSGLSFGLISGIQKIKLAGAEKRAFAKWGGGYARQVEAAYGNQTFIKISPVIITVIGMTGTFILYKKAIDTGVSVPDFYAFNAAFACITAAVTALFGAAGRIAMIKPILEMVSPILEESPEISENRAMVKSISGGVEINNLHFGYGDKSAPVIKGLSLKILPGQYVAIVGKTGCGKSTLMRLLLGFEKPDKGAIYYDGKDLSTLDLKSLRSHIGVVMQNSSLFEGDMFSNIAISSPSLTLDEAYKAAELAGLMEDINTMPMGMFTFISEGGRGLSGGQKQRVMIARAIASSPKILMFDEATSALDNITQKTVSDSLKELKCTRIVIAHRLSTIKDCDRIIVLEGGSIIEDGTYDELKAKGGFFSELVKRQQV